MGLLVAVFIFVWLISTAVNQAKLDHTYARQGMVPPRLENKYGAGARARVAKYGFFDHLRDSWRDTWARRTDATVAARNARAEGGGPPRWRDRFRAADRAVNQTPATAVGPPPADPPPPPPPRSAPAPAPDPEPPATPEAPPGNQPAAATTAPLADQQPPTNPPAPPAPTNGGAPMSAPTGEVTNYETAIAEIDALIPEVQGQIDSAQSALTNLASARAAVDEMQQTYANSAQAAQTKLDHEAAMGLDSTTLAHAATTVDALPVGAVDGLYDRIEEVEAAAKERLDKAEVAMASLQEERAHLIATYGDAHATVQGNLGGDSTFLGSNGGSSAPAATSSGDSDGRPFQPSGPVQLPGGGSREPATAGAGNSSN